MLINAQKAHGVTDKISMMLPNVHLVQQVTDVLQVRAPLHQVSQLVLRIVSVPSELLSLIMLTAPLEPTHHTKTQDLWLTVWLALPEVTVYQMELEK
jgi:hypothetical protein